MTSSIFERARWSVFVAVLLFVWDAAAADLPEIYKIEPPNWWVGHSVNPVRLLVRGRNLSGGHVEAEGGGIRCGDARLNATGTYLFVDLTIESTAKPGKRTLRISTPHGSTKVPFEILAPLSRENRFQGISPDDFIYEIMPDRFADGDPTNDDPPSSRGLFDRSRPHYYHGGDFQGIINHLPYLKQLGVTALWLTPIYDNVNHLNERERPEGSAVTDYHGYGAVDFYGVEEHFGTLAKLKDLVDAAHKLDIKVIQDEVANHTGPYHPWVQDPPTQTWFHGSESSHVDENWQTWTAIDPNAPPELKRGMLDGWFLNILPDLNQEDPEVARYLIQNTLWWLGTIGFDAIREDTLPYVPRSFWHSWTAAIKREYPNVNVVGEVYDGDPAMTSFFQGGAKRFDGEDSGINSVFDFPLLYPIRAAFGQGKSITAVPMVLAHDFLYTDPKGLVTFVGNHDMPRFMSESNATVAGLKLALTFLMTTRGIPMIYYGDELAMPGGKDPDCRRDFPGGWAGDPNNAFEEKGRTPDQQAVFQRVAELARLRATMLPLRRGRLVDLEASEQTYAYARTTENAGNIVVINNGNVYADVEFDATPAKFTDGTFPDRLGSGYRLQILAGKARVKLPARSSAIY